MAGEKLRDMVVITKDGKIQFYGSGGELIGELTDDDFPPEYDQVYIEAMVANTSNLSELAESFAGMGITYSRRGRLDKATIYLEKAAELAPNNADYQYDLAVLYEKKETHQQAETQYKKVLEINPNDHQAWNNLGNVYRRMEKWVEAEKCLKQAIRLNPYQSNPYFNLASLYAKLAKPEAVFFHKLATRLEQFPNDPELQSIIPRLIVEGKI